MEDIISFLVSEKFLIEVNTFFTILWFFLGIVLMLLAFKLLDYLTKKEEVSTVSFLLEPKKTLREINLLFYSSLIFFIGAIFTIPGYLLGNPLMFVEPTSTNPILVLLSFIFGLITFVLGTIHGIIIVFIIFKWVEGFRKYA